MIASLNVVVEGVPCSITLEEYTLVWCQCVIILLLVETNLAFSFTLILKIRQGSKLHDTVYLVRFLSFLQPWLQYTVFSISPCTNSDYDALWVRWHQFFRQEINKLALVYFSFLYGMKLCTFHQIQFFIFCNIWRGNHHPWLWITQYERGRMVVSLPDIMPKLRKLHFKDRWKVSSHWKSTRAWGLFISNSLTSYYPVTHNASQTKFAKGLISH